MDQPQQSTASNVLILPALAKGEFHAGIVFTEDGAPSHWLVGYLPKKVKNADWHAAMKAHGEAMPNRQESRLLVANAKQHMKADWYWTSEQHAGDDDYAWCQDFGDGYQLDFHKDDQCRVVLVRRVPIQSSSHSPIAAARSAA